MAIQTNYLSQYSYQLYDTSGTTDDYIYGALNGFSFTPEIGKVAFHPPYRTGYLPEYLGQPELDDNGVPTGRRLGGLREAFTLAGLAVVDPDSHSIIRGAAPAGRVLRLTKPVAFQTSDKPDDAGLQLPIQTLSETRNLTLTVPASGRYEWAVNPSRQPGSEPSPWRMTCEDAAGTVLEARDVYVERGQQVTADLACGAVAPTPPSGPACDVAAALETAKVTRSGAGLRFSFSRAPGAGRATVTVSQIARGRAIVKSKRVKRFARRRGSFKWSGKLKGKRLIDGVYTVRISARDDDGRTDARSFRVDRANGRFGRGSLYSRSGC